MRRYNLSLAIKAVILLLAAMYALFLMLDFDALSFFNAGIYSSVVKFCSIVVCFGMVWIGGRRNQDKADRALLCAALLFTVCADACLLLLDAYIWGLLCNGGKVIKYALTYFHSQSVKFTPDFRKFSLSLQYERKFV